MNQTATATLKIRMQTFPPGTFPTTLRAAFLVIKNAEGINGFYKSLVPLWSKQIPHIMMKFVCFERTVEARQFKKRRSMDATPQDSLSVGESNGETVEIFVNNDVKRSESGKAAGNFTVFTTEAM